MPWIPGIIVSYLIGSIPTAYIFGRLLKGIDIRKFGSGNVGATNAFRVLGRKAGITVLILDIFKGFAAVVFLGGSDKLLGVILGLSVVAGHNWSVFLKFKGGKGIAVTLGVLIGLAFQISSLKIILALVLLIWLAVFIFTKIVSIASVLSIITLPIWMILFRESALLVSLSIILSVFIVFRHRANLARFFRGEEPRIVP